MESVILVIHLFLALSIIGLVLLQRSEGGGLGIGGNQGGAGNFASARGTANFLTRATGICAALFFITSLTLGIMAGQHTGEKTGILNSLDTSATAPIEAPVDGMENNAGNADNVNNEGIIPAAPLQPEINEDVPANDAELPEAPIAQ